MGLPPETVKQSKAMPSSILKEVTEGGKATMQLAMPARQVAEDFGTRVSDRVTLLGMHTIEHAGADVPAVATRGYGISLVEF
ncbi:hypothetical protein BH18VER1_BH18VER1_13910 [soil metagenome]